MAEAAKQPDYLGFLDNLFGPSGGHMEYLNSLTAAGSPAAGLQLPTSFATNTEMGTTGAPPATAATSGQMVTVEGLRDPIPYEQFEQMRQGMGLADPNAFKLEDYDPYLHGASWGGEDKAYQGHVAYKPKEGTAAFSTGKDQWVQPRDTEQAGFEFDPTTYKPKDGVMAFAGNTGDKGRTRVAYNYDNDGKFTGAHFATENVGFKDDLKNMAPTLSFLLAPFLPGVSSAVGSAVQAAVPALGATGASMAGGALVGGGLAAMGGGNVGLGALTGGIGAGISAMNPASKLFNVTDKATQGLINSGISTAVKTGLNTANTRR